jgi:hypothetical protein
MNDLEKSAEKTPRSHFKWLLFLLMALFVVYPLIAEHVVPRGLFDVFLLVIFFGSIRVATDQKRKLFLVIALGFLAIILRSTNYVIDTQFMHIMAAISYVSFFVVVSIIIIKHALRAERINNEKICAAISAYMFLVLAWRNLSMKVRHFVVSVKLRSPRVC